MKPDFSEPAPVRTKRKLTEEGHVEELMDMHDVAPQALHQHGRTVKDGMKGAEEMLDRAKDVIAAIDLLSSEIRGPWAEYQEFVKRAIAETREQRIALGSESRLLMTALRDVRQFFMDENYEKEIGRLHEFIDLCERMKALKQDGFIDAIADTILKLSSR
jgi:hypothetical protein